MEKLFGLFDRFVLFLYLAQLLNTVLEYFDFLAIHNHVRVSL